MQEKTATLPSATQQPSRLPTTPDGTVDLIKLGSVVHRKKTGRRLTARKEAIYAEAFAHPLGPRMISDAGIAYSEYRMQKARERGETVITERSEWRDGQQIVSTHVESFGSDTVPEGHANGHRGGADRRPKSQATRSSARSGDSGDDGEPGEAEPPSERAPCEWCGADLSHKNSDAKFCSDKHRVNANRARDKANPDRVALRAVENGTSGRAAVCRCDPPGHLVDDGHCIPCGHDRVGAAA